MPNGLWEKEKTVKQPANGKNAEEYQRKVKPGTPAEELKKNIKSKQEQMKEIIKSIK